MATDPILKLLTGQLETERLSLRAPHPGDGAALNAAILETIEDLQRFPASMPWALPTPSVDDSEHYCSQAFTDFMQRHDLPLLLWCKRTGELAGACGLLRFDWRVPKCEIGYWCRRRFQGRGLTAEAVRTLTAFAFDALGVRRVELRTDELNDASRCVAERTGFALEGVLRHAAIDPDGVLRTMRVYAQVR